jgi:hypothetical protein
MEEPNTKPKPDTKQNQKAGIELKDDPLLHFDNVKKRMLDTLPGIRPTNSDVIRYALHIASEVISDEATEA